MRPTTRNAHEFISDIKDFKTSGSLYAKSNEDGLYIVWSYQEPIAIWKKGNGWLVTNKTFSRTTSRHTSQARLGAHFQGDECHEMDHRYIREIVFTSRLELVDKKLSA